MNEHFLIFFLSPALHSTEGKKLNLKIIQYSTVSLSLNDRREIVLSFVFLELDADRAKCTDHLLPR